MSEPTPVAVTLTRVDDGPDLWTAIEAAQYARVIDHVPPENDAEAAAMSALVGLFSDCSERWEQETATDQKSALEQMGNRLEALREMGLFAYAGMTQVRVAAEDGETVEIPLAILILRRDYHQTVDVTLPAASETGN